MKKEVKESLTSLKLLMPIGLGRHHPEEVVLLLLGSFLSSLLGSLFGCFLRRFLLGGHLITSLRALGFLSVGLCKACNGMPQDIVSGPWLLGEKRAGIRRGSRSFRFAE